MTTELQAHADAELVLLSTLRRVALPLHVERLSEADLDKRQVERLTVSAKHRGLVETQAGIAIGCAYTPPPAPLFREAERVQGLVLRAGRTDGEYIGPPAWVYAADMAADDEHVQAMVATPAGQDRERRHRIVDGIVYTLFFALLMCLCVEGWNVWLPGGGK